VKAEFLCYDRELALTQVGGNPKIADELLEMMLRELPGQRIAMAGAVESGQLDQLRSIVHCVRGAASCCGTPGVAETSGALEYALKLGAESDIPELLEALFDEIESLVSDREVP
jgi:HPt (histidine-containing phosphotransfer) domain-containing protein